MKNLMGCLLVLIGIPAAGVVLYLLAWLVCLLAVIFVRLILPLLVIAAIVLGAPYLAYQFHKGLNS